MNQLFQYLSCSPIDPLSVLTNLARAVKYLWDLSEKVHQNRDECQHLAANTDEVLKLIEEDLKIGASPTVYLRRVQKLTKLV